MTRQVTIKDVSEAAQVSVFTASRALSGHAGVAAPTRERVKQAARELGYVPNQLARNLRRQKSRTIGVLTANVSDQYYSALVDALEKVVRREGYQCFVTDAVSDGAYRVEHENAFVASLLENRVAGVVVTYSLTEENLASLLAWRMPLLFVDCPPPESHRELPFVTADNYTASREVGAHLAAHGYRRWGFIGHTGTWTTRQPREQGFVDAAAACGAQVAVIEGANDSDSARRAVLAHLSARPRPEWPEALYAANTPLLHGTMLALRERGLRVPDDMALVAFDDFEWAPMLDPPLTVVDQRIEEIGAAAGRQILLQLAEEPIPEAERARIVRPVLRLRRSCGCRHG